MLDWFGRQVKRLGISKQQADENSEVAKLAAWPEHPSSGLTPTKLAQIMLDAEQGNLAAQCQLADDFEEKDAHLFAELSKRKRALQGQDWRIVPPRDASKAEIDDCEMIEQTLMDLPLDDLIFDLADGILKGFSNCEIKWERDGQFFFPGQFDHRPADWFKTALDNPNKLLLNTIGEGEELQPFGWISHRHRAKTGYVTRAGLVRTLAWPYLFKNYSVRDLAQFIEIYGLPVRLGRYGTGASDSEKQTLLRAIMSVGHNTGGIIPKGMDIEFKEAAKGQSDPFEVMLRWAELSMSKAILGGTLTSQADGKSSTNALGNVHNEVREELRDSDLTQIAATLTRDLVYPLYVLNGKTFSNRRRLPRFEFDLSEPEDLAAYTPYLETLSRLGMQIPVQWAHEKFQIPKAEEGEEILGAVPATPVPNQEKAELAAKASGPLAALTADPIAGDAEEQDPIELALERLMTDDWVNVQADELMQPLWDAIKTEGIEGLTDTAAKLWPHLNDSQLEQQLTTVMLVAEVTAKVEAEEENEAGDD